MAKKQQKSSLMLKKKKKVLFSVVAPKVLNAVPLGHTFANSAEELIGRTIEVNLMNVTMDIRKQQYKMKFMITGVDGSTAKTKPVAFSMVAASVKRLVRRNRDKVEDSFTTYTKDKIFIRIKPLLITLNNVSSSVRTALRKSTRYFIKKYLQEHNYNTLVRELVAGSFQHELQNFLKKIYPLRTVEIRAMHIEKFKQRIKTAESEVISQVSGMEETVDPEREKAAVEAGKRRPRRVTRQRRNSRYQQRQGHDKEGKEQHQEGQENVTEEKSQERVEQQNTTETPTETAASQAEK